MSFISSAEEKQNGPTDQLIQTLIDSIPLYNTSMCYPLLNIGSKTLLLDVYISVSYTHLTLPTIYSV